MKNLAVKHEPVLKIHRYVVAVTRGSSTKYSYHLNRNDVRKFKKSLQLKAGDRAEVFKATHDFKEAWGPK